MIELLRRRPTVSRETSTRLERYVALLLEENERQNLIAASTLDDSGNATSLDSAQLVALSHGRASWFDIGSGAGLPGMVIAILVGGPVTLVEPRRLRADFLAHAVGRTRARRAQVVRGEGRARHAASST